MDENLLSALKYIPVADLDRADWIAVGMALKQEGYSCAVWDEWSQNDKRYKKGECARLWTGFHGNKNPVKAGTIVQMAQDRGWEPFKASETIGWDDSISYDGDGPQNLPDANPADELVTYLQTLFKPDEHVAFVTSDVWNNDGKWNPGKGRYDLTAQQIIDGLKKHPDDMGATLGDWKSEAGAWIRFNPVDGHGVKNDNVTAFRYSLVESDTMPIEEQRALYKKLELPIAALVYSGGKSLHAIVHVDAADLAEYQDRVDFLYQTLQKYGIEVDKQNRNPSRLSRMPGITRNGKLQHLEAVNIGRKSWKDWKEYIEGTNDRFPEIVPLGQALKTMKPLREPLINGVLRIGHKMLIGGPSKAGKSFLLMELCVAIAEGRKWLNFQVKKGKVLYINLEIDPDSALHRFEAIYDALGIEPSENFDNIEIWNLRGYAVPMDELVPYLIARVRNKEFLAVVLDPIYKVITGDENSAKDMGFFCNQFDRVCAETGVSMIYCHHHSKGAQGSKKAIDRVSGSGVFARDPDAIVDIIELEMTDDIKNNFRDGNETAFRIEITVREFAPVKPFDIWFDYPLHYIDETGALAAIHPQGSQMANLMKSSKSTTPEGRKRDIDRAYNNLHIGNEPPTVEDMASYLEITTRCVKDRIKEYSEKYYIKRGYVFEKTDDE